MSSTYKSGGMRSGSRSEVVGVRACSRSDNSYKACSMRSNNRYWAGGMRSGMRSGNRFKAGNAKATGEERKTRATSRMMKV